MKCDNHLHGDDSSCSRRISFTFARYLDGVERGELPINTVADEQQQQQQQQQQQRRMRRRIWTWNRLSLTAETVYWTRFVSRNTMSNTQSF
ncbi:hypothetical protein CEXT_703471 [Caerostris extrusa]|uniref:Uncharacterized protein n=1 Tax=Caerostris extrusa TaxID=172846 RepID=A0AAV4NNR8_CAEEX|nr:hypothetical protein CEXT_703471 [Caerostris extrusa]